MEGGGEERSATPQHVKAYTPVFSPGCGGRAREEEGGGGRRRKGEGSRSLFCDYEEDGGGQGK